MIYDGFRSVEQSVLVLLEDSWLGFNGKSSSSKTICQPVAKATSLIASVLVAFVGNRRDWTLAPDKLWQAQPTARQRGATAAGSRLLGLTETVDLVPDTWESRLAK